MRLSRSDITRPSATPESTRPEANLTPQVVVALPAPTRASSLHVEQILTAQIKGSSKEQGHSLLVVMEADGQRLSLVGFSLLGVRLFRVEYGMDGIRLPASSGSNDSASASSR